MAVEIIVALITLGGSALGTFAGILLNSKLSNYRIEQLEKKVDKHNNIIERVYLLEKSEAVMEEEIKVANHRINDLEVYQIKERILDHGKEFKKVGKSSSYTCY